MYDFKEFNTSFGKSLFYIENVCFVVHTVSIVRLQNSSNGYVQYSTKSDKNCLEFRKFFDEYRFHILVNSNIYKSYYSRNFSLASAKLFLAFYVIFLPEFKMYRTAYLRKWG